MNNIEIGTTVLVISGSLKGQYGIVRRAYGSSKPNSKTITIWGFEGKKRGITQMRCGAEQTR